MANIYTVQIYEADWLQLTKDPGYIDVSTKGGNEVFAPTWQMTIGHMKDELSEEDYERQYYNLMRKSYRLNREEWDKVLSMDNVYLACYCSASKFCHRHLLSDILVRCGATKIGEKRYRRYSINLWPNKTLGTRW